MDLIKSRDALEKLKKFLEDYRMKLDTELQEYRSLLQGSDMGQNLQDDCEDYFRKHESCIEEVIKNIENDELPFITGQINAMEDDLRKWGN